MNIGYLLIYVVICVAPIAGIGLLTREMFGDTQMHWTVSVVASAMWVAFVFLPLARRGVIDVIANCCTSFLKENKA